MDGILVKVIKNIFVLYLFAHIALSVKPYLHRVVSYLTWLLLRVPFNLYTKWHLPVIYSHILCFISDWLMTANYQIMPTLWKRATALEQNLQALNIVYGVCWDAMQRTFSISRHFYIQGHTKHITPYCTGPCYHDDVIKWKHFRVTGPLCGEFTGRRWISLTKASDAELWCFLWSAPE